MTKDSPSTTAGGRVRTVEYEPGEGWIARSPFDGRELGGNGFRWRTRSVARCVVDEERFSKARTIAKTGGA
jgi:hypothetical protein